MINQLKSGIKLFMSLGLLTVATTAISATETEVNNTFASADAADIGSNIGAVGDLTGPSSDIDMWAFNLTAGSFMSANITNGAGADFGGFNPSMVLFMEHAGSYFAVSGANQFTGTSFSFTPWQSGTYYLSVSGFNNAPVNGFSQALDSSTWWVTEAHNLDSLTAANLAYAGIQGGNQFSFDYSLSLSGVSPVPVPAAAWLMASGLLGLVGVARRKRS